MRVTDPESGEDGPLLTASARSIGAIRETASGERRVAVTPASPSLLVKAGFEVRVETGAGLASGYTDQVYEDAGASVVDRAEALGADVVARVRATAWSQEAEAGDGIAHRVVDDEQPAANGMLHRFAHPSLGPVTVLGPAVGLDVDGFRAGPPTAAFGSEAKAILEWAGVPPSEVERLIATGIVTPKP